MKIWVLTENTASREDILAEHGLSLYIETGDRRILFDMGQTDAFARNAGTMGIDLSRVDLAVVSHGHYDHGGGLETFLEINPHAPVYVSRYAFGGYYNAAGKYIGLDPKLKHSGRLIPGGSTRLGEGICLHSPNGWEASVPVDSAGLQKWGEDGMQPDDFLHEQYLVIREKGMTVCFSGCSHKGIVNITRWIPSDVCIGGFHFMKQDPQAETVREAARILSGSSTQFYTCHCTGGKQFDAMKSVMGQKLQALRAGDILQIGEA